MNDRTLRVGLFGCGRMGLVHLQHLAGMALRGGVTLAALGDRHAPALAHAAAALAPASGPGPVPAPRLFDTPEAMASQAGLDACVVASRTQDHCRDTLALVRRGIAVLLEKPLGGSVADAAALCRSLDDAGRGRVQIAFQRHYDAAARTATGWFDQGRIGALQQSHHVLQDKNPTPAGYQSGGITADMAIHLVFEAMAFHGFALPRQVQALRFLAPHYEDRAGEGANVVHVFCSWADGSLAHLWGSRINSTGYDNGFKLIGTRGRIDVGEFAGDFGPVSARLWTGTDDTGGPRGVLAESRAFAMTRATGAQPDFYPRYAGAYAAELAAFLDHVRDGAALEPGLDVGWKTQLVADLAEHSARLDGRRFTLQLPDGKPIGSADEALRCWDALGAGSQR